MRWALAILASSSIASAGEHHTIVLPIDGSAEPATRSQLDAIVEDLAKTEPGTITTGNATFAETATAVGCDPKTPACGDTVLATLGVDEIVFGTADGTTLVVSRVIKGQARRDQAVAIGNAGPALRPLFDLPPAVVAQPPAPPVEPRFFAVRDNQIGIGLVAGGALVAVLGLALWASESSVQSQIDSAPAKSSGDIANLLTLEDRASHYAWEGNIAIVVGLAAAGVGTYFLVRDHEVHATVGPTAITLGGRW